MPKTLTTGQFETAINSILAQYKGAVDEDVAEVTRAVGRRTVQKVQQNIDAAGINGTGEYKRSIAVKNTKDAARNYNEAVVYAKEPHYRLTHLLEYGHAVVTAGGRKPGPGKQTFVQARPHWADAEREAIKEFEQRLKEAIESK